MDTDNAVSVEDFEDLDQEDEVLEDQNCTDSVQKKYQTRRKIEDLLDFKRMRGEQGWMDDFNLDFEEVF